MKSKYRLNISNENTSSALKCAVSVKYPPDFKNLIYIKHTKNINYLSNNFYIICCKDNLGVQWVNNILKLISPVGK